MFSLVSNLASVLSSVGVAGSLSPVICNPTRFSDEMQLTYGGYTLHTDTQLKKPKNNAQKSSREAAITKVKLLKPSLFAKREQNMSTWILTYAITNYVTIVIRLRYTKIGWFCYPFCNLELCFLCCGAFSFLNLFLGISCSKQNASKYFFCFPRRRGNKRKRWQNTDEWWMNAKRNREIKTLMLIFETQARKPIFHFHQPSGTWPAKVLDEQIGSKLFFSRNLILIFCCKPEFLAVQIS